MLYFCNFLKQFHNIKIIGAFIKKPGVKILSIFFFVFSKITIALCFVKSLRRLNIICWRFFIIFPCELFGVLIQIRIVLINYTPWQLYYIEMQIAWRFNKTSCRFFVFSWNSIIFNRNDLGRSLNILYRYINILIKSVLNLIKNGLALEISCAILILKLHGV